MALDIDRVIAWLASALQAPQITDAWVYGSYAQGVPTANDVDVLVCYRSGWAAGAATWRREVEALFALEFTIPLHAIFLSADEIKNESSFIKMLLANSHQVPIANLGT
ncbi:nucleotidyltransferase domain-containing protein [Kinneretia aquatilis]|uniref:nucleotidyltransferase domain-containing protein n=1 Tax=Kinneretia aquatilis TaxID=2070761 RepID=UPI001056F1DC|nr:nucleotidyltransferase domain-containing protein [Paucibacter aquatile]